MHISTRLLLGDKDSLLGKQYGRDKRSSQISLRIRCESSMTVVIKPFGFNQFKDLCDPSTLDCDNYAFNLIVNQELSGILQQLCGQTVILANPKIRKCDRSLCAA